MKSTTQPEIFKAVLDDLSLGTEQIQSGYRNKSSTKLNPVLGSIGGETGEERRLIGSVTCNTVTQKQYRKKSDGKITTVKATYPHFPRARSRGRKIHEHEERTQQREEAIQDLEGVIQARGWRIKGGELRR